MDLKEQTLIKNIKGKKGKEFHNASQPLLSYYGQKIRENTLKFSWLFRINLKLKKIPFNIYKQKVIDLLDSNDLIDKLDNNVDSIRWSEIYEYSSGRNKKTIMKNVKNLNKQQDEILNQRRHAEKNQNEIMKWFFDNKLKPPIYHAYCMDYYDKGMRKL